MADKEESLSPLSSDVLLKKAKAFERDGDLKLAKEHLAQAIKGNSLDTSFLQKCTGLVKKLKGKKDCIKVGLLSSSTTTFLAPILETQAWAEGLALEIYEGPFGNYQQEIFSDKSGLFAFQPDFVILALSWRDYLHLGVEELKTLWQALLERLPEVKILQHNADFPAYPSDGYLAWQDEAGTIKKLKTFNQKLKASKLPSVTIVDTERLCCEQGTFHWNDASIWFSAKQQPALRVLPVLTQQYIRLIQHHLGKIRKVLVLDLDNTCWKGVIGEDGIEGIQIGAPSAIGEAYADFQQYAKDLKERGILLAVCSKNNESDASLPFEKHDGMVLKKSDILVFCANWQPKSENLRYIAQQLNVGTDSLVFVDDSPNECLEVKHHLPEVEVIQLPKDAALLCATVFQKNCFERLSLSETDKERHESYRQNIQRKALQADALSPKTFLKNLNMQATAKPFDAASLIRIEQLFQRTNQFNLTTRRHTRAFLEQCIFSEKYWTQSFRLKDNFGDYGIVGALLVEKGAEAWSIDSFILSCRVIGVGLECFMMETLTKAAQNAGIQKIHATYVPTERNQVAKNLFPELGFQVTSETKEQTTFTLDKFPKFEHYIAGKAQQEPITC